MIYVNGTYSLLSRVAVRGSADASGQLTIIVAADSISGAASTPSTLNIGQSVGQSL